MSSELQFAIIGCGKIAPRHAAEAARQGKLIAVCDIRPARADKLAEEYGAKPYYDITDLLEKEPSIDLLAICTPNGLHANHTIQALEAGRHVLCEKPLSISSEDARKMMATAQRKGRKLFVVKSTRYNPALGALKKLIDQQGLGKIYSFQMNCFWNRPAAYYNNNWKGSLDMDGGALYTQFSHYIDALLWLLGDVSKVVGFRKNYAHKDLIAYEDSGVVSLEMKNGIIGGLNWSLNTFQKNMEVSLSLIAEKGSIRIGGEYMNQLEYELLEDMKLDIPGGGQANDYGFYAGSMSNHNHVYENLVIALKDEAHPFAQAIDGLKTVETIESIYNSVSLSEG